MKNSGERKANWKKKKNLGRGGEVSTRKGEKGWKNSYAFQKRRDAKEVAKGAVQETERGKWLLLRKKEENKIQGKKSGGDNHQSLRTREPTGEEKALGGEDLSLAKGGRT